MGGGKTKFEFSGNTKTGLKNPNVLFTVPSFPLRTTDSHTGLVLVADIMLHSTCIISDLMSTTMKKRQQGRVGLFKETETTPSAEGNLRCDCHGNDFLMQVGGSRGFCCVSSQSSDATGQLEA